MDAHAFWEKVQAIFKDRQDEWPIPVYLVKLRLSKVFKDSTSKEHLALLGSSSDGGVGLLPEAERSSFVESVVLKD